MGFSNLGRGVYELSLAAIAREILHDKKKRAVAMLKKDPALFYKNIAEWAMRCGRMRSLGELTCALHWVTCYDSAKHYYVSNIDSNLNTRDYTDIDVIAELGDSFTIEMQVDIGEGNVCNVLGNFMSVDRMNIGDVEVAYCVDILCQHPKFVMDLPKSWFVCYVTKDGRVFVEYNRKCLYTAEAPRGTCEITTESGNTLTIPVVKRGSKESELCTTLFSALALSVMAIINERNSVHASSGRRCSHKLHTANTEIVNVVMEDKLLPLKQYYCEHAKYEYKGGHHASPIEHDRRGFFRKSRGRGDYELINDEFVFVGNKEGHYSYVNPTHVHGRNGVLIYEV